MRQARTSFNRALSVLRMPGIFAVHPALRVVSRRDFPRQKANSPESSRKVYENFFQTLYFSKSSSLSGNCWYTSFISIAQCSKNFFRVACKFFVAFFFSQVKRQHEVLPCSTCISQL